MNKKYITRYNLLPLNYFVFVLLTLALGSFTLNANAQVCFKPEADYPVATGGNPQYGATADFNGDGKADLAVSNQTTNQVSILIANATGGFNAPVNYGVGNTPVSVAIGDFNGDGILDVATANFGIPSTPGVSILLGTGGGVLAAANTIPVGVRPYSVAIGDFNGDGKLDLVMADNSSAMAYVFINTGSSTTPFVTATPYALGDAAWTVVTADFNGDGFLDIATANAGTSNNGTTLSILLGSGTGTFGAANNLTVGLAPRQLVAADFNGDGHADIAAVSSGTNMVSVFLNTGTFASPYTLGFGPVVTYGIGTGGNSYGLTTADFSGDGKLDLATSSFYSPFSIAVLQNDGAGGFSATPVSNFIAGGINDYGIIGADFNGDGKPDIAVMCNGTSEVSVLLNVSAPSTSQTITACGQYNGHKTNGTYTDILTSAGGCDSVVITHLTIKPVSTTIQTDTICPGQSVTINGHTYKTSGTFNDKLTASNGCDSIVTTKIIINHVYTGGVPPYITSTITSGIGSQPYVLTTADFNGDGIADMAIPNNASNSVSILLGNGTGGFTNAPTITTNIPWSVANADFNGDGIIDLAVTNMSFNTISIFIGDGLGGFSPASTPTYAAGTGGLVRIVYTADFNNDGKPDLAVSNQGSTDVTILLGNGNGTFTAAAGSPFQSGGFETMGINSGDFNGDGKLDLVVSNMGSSTVSIFLGNGDGTFTAAPTPTVAVGSGPYGVFVADFNNDGNLDIATGNNGSASVSVLFGDGNGGFGQRTDYTVASGPQFGILADFNGDGILDIAVACQYSNTMSILLGNSTGGFSTAPFNFPVGNNSAALTSADFNGDGIPDLAVTNFSGQSVTMLLSPIIPTGATGDTTVCSGVPVQLTAKGGSSFKWVSSTASIACDTCGSPIVSPSVTSTFVVTISNGSCASATDSVTVTVNKGSVIHTSPVDTAICGGSPVVLTSTGATAYTWSPAASLSCNSCAITTANPTVTTTYVVTGTNNGVCPGSDTVVILVGNLANAGLLSTTRDTICQNTPGNLTLAGGTISNIQWQSSTDDINFTDISGAVNVTKYKTTPLQQTTWYRATVGSGSCSAVSDTLELYVPPALVAYFNVTQLGGNRVSFNSDSSSGNIRSYHWDFGDNQTSSDSNPSHTYVADTTYYVCLTLYDGSNCSYTFCRYTSITDAVQTIAASGQWVVYPNPFSGQLTISSKQADSRLQSVKLYNVLGQPVISNNTINSTDNLFHLDVSGLADGMYYLEIRTENGSYVQPVVKQ